MTEQSPSYPGPEQPEPYPAPGAFPPAPEYGHTQPVAVPYAGWWIRVGAQLIDGLIVTALAIVPGVAGAVIAFSDLEIDPVTDEIVGTVDAIGVLLLVLTVVLVIVFDVWNRGARVGSKGQSLGKQVLGVRTVAADTGAYLGTGKGLLRWLVAAALSMVSFVGLIDVLWPLWDDRKQTLHDKIINSVSLRA